jgi:regulator of replication initiation timing
MKHLLIASSFLLLISCGKTSDHSNHSTDDVVDGESPNKVLYDQVMDIHDEVMPKMQDLYTLKKELQDKIDQNKGMAEEQKKELEQVIAALDSTNNAMMDWMHHFNPLPDSADQELAREYLENEMESIMKVRDLTTETIDKAKAIKDKE